MSCPSYTIYRWERKEIGSSKIGFMSACLIIGVLTKNVSKRMLKVGVAWLVVPQTTLWCFLYVYIYIINENFPSFSPHGKKKLLYRVSCVLSKWKNLIKHVKKKKSFSIFVYRSMVMTTHVLTLTFSQKLIK